MEISPFCQFGPSIDGCHLSESGMHPSPLSHTHTCLLRLERDPCSTAKRLGNQQRGPLPQSRTHSCRRFPRTQNDSSQRQNDATYFPYTRDLENVCHHNERCLVSVPAHMNLTLFRSHSQRISSGQGTRGVSGPFVHPPNGKNTGRFLCTRIPVAKSSSDYRVKR